jgi:hypothetical protein
MWVLEKFIPPSHHPSNAILAFIHLKSLMFFFSHPTWGDHKDFYIFLFKFHKRCPMPSQLHVKVLQKLVHHRLNPLHIMIGSLYAIPT